MTKREYKKINLNISKPKITFLLCFFIGLLIAVTGTYFLPERFFFDTWFVSKDPLKVSFMGGSYSVSTLFYDIVRLRKLSFSVIGFLQITIVIFLLYKIIGIPKNFHRLTIKNMVTYFAFIMLGVFLGMPTKEFITILYIFLLLFCLRNIKNDKIALVVFFLLFLFFGYFFRKYYILVALLVVVFYFINRMKFKDRKTVIFIGGLLFTIFLSIGYGFYNKGQFISKITRGNINDMRIRIGDKNANSKLVSPVDADTWYGESISIIYGFISVNIPVNQLLKHILKPHIVAFIIWQLLLFWLLLIQYDRSLKKGVKNNNHLLVLNIFIAYCIIQGLFEPDLGSAIRHKMGLFPLIYFIFYHDNCIIQRDKNYLKWLLKKIKR